MTDPITQVTTLALVAFGELTAFEQSAEDARSAASVEDEVGLALVAGHCLDHFRAISARVEELGGDVVEGMRDAARAFSVFHERTRPGDWYESLMKGYVLDGIMKDFSRAALEDLDPTSVRVVSAALDDTRRADHLRDRLARSLADDPALAARLALWGRRLVAEAMTRGRVLLVQLLGVPEDRVVSITQSCMTAHSKRMSGLGLVA
ncbi:ferritin-like fold-containing protein [Brevibacterium litoralis]|uniref:ferritin-like fold-containing protein n=1 Tax=Brevibacterium litoralis TaxID=3138935 RepID=UPI0032EDA9D8